jgi:predicted dehydrogenase
VEDTVHVITRHRGDILGSFSLNQHQAVNDAQLTIVCERGTVRYEPMQNRWRWASEPGSDWHDEVFPPLERDDLFVAQAQHFLDVVAGTAAPLCPLTEAAQTLNVNLAILESVRTRQWQTVG